MIIVCHILILRAKAFSFALCCYVIGLFNRPQAYHKHNIERNVVRLSAAVSLGGALRDIPKNGCEGDYNNVSPHAFAQLQYQAPIMSDPTLFVRDYNIRPRQCQSPRPRATTISSPDNVRPHAFNYNISPRQCQTPRFSCEITISGPDNVRTHALAQPQYQAPTMSDGPFLPGL